VIRKKRQLYERLLKRRFGGLPLAERLVLFIFATIAAVAGWFHEPWSDEAQAWLIARASAFAESYIRWGTKAVLRFGIFYSGD
jgi:hypothetical protein